MKRLHFYFIITFTTINFLSAYAQNAIQNVDYFLTDKSGKKISAVFSSLSEFDKSGNAIFSIGGNSHNMWGKIIGAKYGIINKTGSIVLPALYDGLEKMVYDNDSLYVFTNGENRGLMNSIGSVMIPEQECTSVSQLYNSNPMAIKVEFSNYDCRIYTIDGKPLTSVMQRFDEETGGFIFQSGAYKGFMDKNYKIILPAKYSSLELLQDGSFLVTDMRNKSYVMDLSGKTLTSTKYDEMRALTSSQDYEKVLGYIVNSKGKYGFIDANLKSVIPVKYKSLYDIGFGCDDFIFSCEIKDNEVCILNSKGQQLSKKSFKYVNQSILFDKYLIVEKASKEKPKKKKKKKKKNDSDDEFDYFEYEPSYYNLVDLSGNLVIPTDFEDYTTVYDELPFSLLLLKNKGTWVGYSKELKPILVGPVGSTEKFTYIENLSDDLYIVQIGGKDEGYGKPEGGVFGLFRGNGTQILPIVYEDITSTGYGDNLMMIIKQAGKYGLYAKDGKMLVDHIYYSIDCADSYCIVKDYIERLSMEKVGLLNALTGKEVIPAKYNQLEKMYYTDYYAYSENNKFGIMSSNGSVVLKPKYTYIKSSDLYENDQFFLANVYGSITADPYGYGTEVVGGNWGVISIKGDTLVPFNYKEIEFVNDSIMNVIDLEGKAFLMAYPSMKIIINKEANYIGAIGYDYLNPIYLVGKDVMIDEYDSRSGGIYGLMDLKGNVISDLKYSEIIEENSFFICNYIEFDGFDLLDNKGNIIQEKVDFVQKLNDSIFIVSKSGSVYLYNVRSKSINDLGGAVQYSAPDYFYNTAFIGVKMKNEKWGVINNNGDWIINAEYCNVTGSDQQFIIAAVCAGTAYKYGVIDSENNILIPFEYDSIEEDYDSKYSCVKGTTLYTINLMNEILKKEDASDENIRN
jgi:hypothetical protein